MNELTRRDLIERSAAAVAATALPAALAAESGTPGADLLRYRQPARKWVEALPVGNGRIGAMVFGGIAEERLQLNEDTLWTGGPYTAVNPDAHDTLPEVRRLVFAGQYPEAEALINAKVMAKPLVQMAYQTFADLLIDLPGIPEFWATDYRRELDLDSATATTRYKVGGAVYLREVFACPVHQVIVMRISADRPGKIDCGVTLRSPQPAALRIEDDTLILSGRNRDDNGIAGALKLEARVRVVPDGGTSEARAAGLGVRGANSVTLFVAMATSYRRFDDINGDPAATTRGQIARASAAGFDAVATAARAEHRRLYRAARVDFGRTAASDLPTDERIRASDTADDPALAALYFHYGRYLLICSSRPGSQPANLQGLWNDSDSPPWGSKYTININTEMNYWPAETTGLAECTTPLIALVRDLAKTGERTARDMYGARGWVAHHNTDLWRATAPIDGAQWGMWAMGGAWLCTHLWKRYDYGRDRAYLASVYPLMRGAAEFFVDVLQVDPRSGFLVTNPSLSPENTHAKGSSICAGPAMDMEILRDLFAQTAQAASILGVDSAFARQMLKVRDRLAPARIGAQGQLQEWQEDWDAAAPEPHHRHVSHLYALYPSQQIDLEETPALAAAARRSLELRGDDTGGWGTAWRANLWARLGDGENAHRSLRLLLGSQHAYPDLLNANPFQIDGNFGGTAAVVEMLMQVRGDDILLLPALPKAWPSGSARGLRAPGACTVDLSWSDGGLTSATVTAAIASRRTVRLGDRRKEVQLKPGRPLRLTPRDMHGSGSGG